MRIAHLTDIHFYHPPKVSELTHLKRLMGTTNLFVLGRKSKFDITVQRALVQSVCEQEPDLVLITGDFTAQALESEFKLAHEELQPILDRFPTRLVPGNHDIYTNSEQNRQTMRTYFGSHMPQNLCRYDEFGDVGVLLFDTCQPDLLSRGLADESQFADATELLRTATAEFVFMCIHYPLRGRRGEPYGPSTRALRNAEKLEQWLGQQSRIKAILHGHEHHGYKVELSTPTGPKIILNPGTSGYALDEGKRRRAHYNLYQVRDGRLQNIERFAYSSGGFKAEVPEAYATKG